MTQGAGQRCCVCGKETMADKILTFGSEAVCMVCKDQYVTQLRAGDDGVPELPLRLDGRKVLAPLNATLPPRCVKCGEDATIMLDKKLTYSPAWAFLVGGAIVSLAMQKKTTVKYGLCDRHRTRRKYGLIAAWGGGILTVLLLIAGIAVAQASPDLSMVLMGLCIPLLLLTLLVSGLMTRTISASKIDNQWVWISGTGKAFRNQL